MSVLALDLLDVGFQYPILSYLEATKVVFDEKLPQLARAGINGMILLSDLTNREYRYGLAPTASNPATRKLLEMIRFCLRNIEIWSFHKVLTFRSSSMFN